MLLWPWLCEYLFENLLSVLFGYIPRNGIAESYGHSISNILRTHHAVFHGGCAILHSHQRCMRVPIAALPCQHLLFLFFPTVAIWLGVGWYLIVKLYYRLITRVIREYILILHHSNDTHPAGAQFIHRPILSLRVGALNEDSRWVPVMYLRRTKLGGSSIEQNKVPTVTAVEGGSRE